MKEEHNREENKVQKTKQDRKQHRDIFMGEPGNGLNHLTYFDFSYRTYMTVRICNNM